MTGMAWMPEEPVPKTPTRWPVKSTTSCGQSPVWYHLPLKHSIPLSSGTRAADKAPVAMITNLADKRSPWSVSTRHLFAVSS